MIIFHKSNVPWLVLWNIFIFHILGIIIPTDFHIFQRGWNHQAEMFVVQSTYCCSNYFTVNSKKLLIKWIKLQLLMLCLINPTIPQFHNSWSIPNIPQLWMFGVQSPRFFDVSRGQPVWLPPTVPVSERPLPRGLWGGHWSRPPIDQLFGQSLHIY
jgi:hypothetical protein